MGVLALSSGHSRQEYRTRGGEARSGIPHVPETRLDELGRANLEQTRQSRPDPDAFPGRKSFDRFRLIPLRSGGYRKRAERCASPGLAPRRTGAGGRIWHTFDSQGQIMALALKQKSSTRLRLSSLGSGADRKRAGEARQSRMRTSTNLGGRYRMPTL